MLIDPSDDGYDDGAWLLYFDRPMHPKLKRQLQVDADVLERSERSCCLCLSQGCSFESALLSCDISCRKVVVARSPRSPSKTVGALHSGS